MKKPFVTSMMKFGCIPIRQCTIWFSSIGSPKRSRRRSGLLVTSINELGSSCLAKMKPVPWLLIICARVNTCCARLEEGRTGPVWRKPSSRQNCRLTCLASNRPLHAEGSTLATTAPCLRQPADAGARVLRRACSPHERCCQGDYDGRLQLSLRGAFFREAHADRSSHQAAAGADDPGAGAARHGIGRLALARTSEPECADQMA